MKKNNVNIIALIIALLVMPGANAQISNDSLKKKAMEVIREKYISNNVPDGKDFDSLLARDLNNYFIHKYGKVNVMWEFLREEPTQSGVSYPKYYLWIKINKQDKLINEGAVRVEAIEKKSFNITDFVERKQIKDKSVDIYLTFPARVCEQMESRAK